MNFTKILQTVYSADIWSQADGRTDGRGLQIRHSVST